MAGDPRAMRGWIQRWGGEETPRAGQRRSSERLRRERADAGPIDGYGPVTRWTLALVRGDRAGALEAARAIDRALGLYGCRLPDEPEGRRS
jgi:hypothetical protein